MNDTSFNTYSLFRLISKVVSRGSKKEFSIYARGCPQNESDLLAVKGCHPSELGFVP